MGAIASVLSSALLAVEAIGAIVIGVTVVLQGVHVIRDLIRRLRG